MNIQEHLANKLEQLGIQPGGKLLCAVSGGVDSMVLLYALHKLGYKVQAAHCNFGLRAEASDADTTLVKQFCEENDLPFYVKYFKTPEEKKHRENTQLAARRLRFTWFESLLQETQSQCVLLAHHIDDSIETFFINLFRGSGVKGLMGIQEQRECYIRPFLEVEKDAIYMYAEKNQIPYREDESNFSDAYERNKLRLYLKPLLKDVFPKALKGIQNSMQNLRVSRAVEESWFMLMYEKALVSQTTELLKIDLAQIPQDPILQQAFLHQMCKPYGFNKEQVLNMVEGIGKGASLKFESAKKNAYIKGTRLELCSTEVQQRNPDTIFSSLEELLQNADYCSELLDINALQLQTSAQVAQLDYNSITWPIYIGKPTLGERFYPLGMNNKKLIAQFLKDIKASAIDKNKQLVWRDAKGVFWVEGLRIDNQYKVGEKTTQVLVIKLK